MNKIKLSLISLLSLIFVIFSFAACSGGGNGGNDGSGSGGSSKPATSESAPESVSAREYADGEYTLLDFESAKDLYCVRPYISDILDMYGKISVEEDEEHARSGKGTLKYAYEAGKTPSVAFYPVHSDYPDIPINKLASFGISVFSGATKKQTVTLSVVSGKEPVYEETRDLEIGWNDYVFELDPVLVKFRSDEIIAFCVGFETGSPCDYYLDKWTATVGEKPLNDIQKTALSFAETVEGLGNAASPDPDKLLEAYGYYGVLDEACRSAVAAYYDDYLKAVGRFLDIKSRGESSQNAAPMRFSDNYGVLQLGETEGVRFGYDPDAFGSGKGGTTLTFAGFEDFENGGDETKVPEKTELKFNVEVTTSTIIVSNHDYIAFALKNDSDKAFSFRFNGSANYVTVSAGETLEVELPATDLVESGNAMTFAFDYTEGEVSPAAVAISTVYARTVSREKIYLSALKDGKYSADGNVEISGAGDKFKFDFKDENAKIVADKAFDDINVSQNVLFSVAADKNVTLGIYNASGELAKNFDISATASVITLSASEYDALSFIKVSEKCALTVSEMLLSRAVDNDYTEIVLKNDYVVAAGDITAETAREAVYFVSSFESMVLYKQNYMKNDNADVYADIAARAAKISDVFKSIVKNLGNGTATESECMLILDLSGTYSLLKSVTPLTKHEFDIIDVAKKTTLLKYKYTLFDFNDPMATSNFGKQTKWWDWSGNISVEEFDGGKKMSIGVQRVMPDGDRNARRIYINYDFSSSSSVLGGYDYVAWRIYNANSSDKTIFFVTYGWGSTVYSCTLKAKQWTDIKLTINDFKNSGQFVIYPTDPGDRFYIDNVYACSVEYVQAAIDAIPDAKDIGGADRDTVNFARAEYDKLSALAKKKVDATRLFAAEDKLTTLPYTVFGMSKEETLSSFSHPTDIPSYLWDGDPSLGDFSIISDEIYGKVLSVNTVGTTGKQPVVYMGYTVKDNISAYDFVTFNVYNPKNAVLTFAVITRGWGKSYYSCKLNACGWTEVTLPVSDFLSAGYFYFANVEKGEKLSFLITDVVAHGAASVQGMIDDLPDADKVTYADTDAIRTARKWYNALSDGAKGKVKVEKLVACEEVLSNIPYTVFDMSEAGILTKFAHPTDIPSYVWNGSFSIVDNAEGGKAMKVGTEGTNTVVYIGYNLSGIDLSKYGKVTFKVYNPSSATLKFALITRGWGKAYHQCDLGADGWTEITVSADDFKAAGYFYFADFRDAGDNAHILISDIVAHN